MCKFLEHTLSINFFYKLNLIMFWSATTVLTLARFEKVQTKLVIQIRSHTVSKTNTPKKEKKHKPKNFFSFHYFP